MDDLTYSIEIMHDSLINVMAERALEHGLADAMEHFTYWVGELLETPRALRVRLVVRDDAGLVCKELASVDRATAALITVAD